jgi:hypothetical protein
MNRVLIHNVQQPPVPSKRPYGRHSLISIPHTPLTVTLTDVRAASDDESDGSQFENSASSDTIHVEDEDIDVDLVVENRVCFKFSLFKSRVHRTGNPVPGGGRVQPEGLKFFL